MPEFGNDHDDVPENPAPQIDLDSEPQDPDGYHSHGIQPIDINEHLQEPDVGDGASPADASKPGANPLDQVTGTLDQERVPDESDADTAAWTDAERTYVGHFAERALRALDQLDRLAEQGERDAAKMSPDIRQDILDLAGDLRVEGELARERIGTLVTQSNDAEATITQVVAMYESLRGQIEDANARLDEWNAGGGAAPQSTSKAWLNRISSLIISLLRRLASVLAGMAHPKEWVLKGEIGWFLTKGQIEIKFGRP